MEAQISINQLVDFSRSTTTTGKKKILRSQKQTDKVRALWYQDAKAGMKKYFSDVNNIEVILRTIEIIKHKPDNGEKKLRDRRTASINLLQKFLELKAPISLRNLHYDIYKSHQKSVHRRGVKLIVAPEVVFKFKKNGVTHYGAVKFHTSKSKKFKSEHASLASTLIYYYMKSEVAGPGEIVVPEFCICLDVFGVGYNHTPILQRKYMMQLNKLCDEIREMWESIN